MENFEFKKINSVITKYCTISKYKNTREISFYNLLLIEVLS